MMNNRILQQLPQDAVARIVRRRLIQHIADVYQVLL
jgi:hypothetical protein